ncbi:DUF397 domain-containing protein [Streptomyces sp. H27-C3]|uniref:DUF397 domain-containing protein n=1 Tax=Streptomyces sp. H27-C3 TaxID=3046305 RepID=UPI0024B99A20|nr:DUF397 domain-containing protein [Streptomyces sp. H27-C3]MDJ0463118.1 DUF397 domain-containing protein [Streptomyces sp. H27-C3]
MMRHDLPADRWIKSSYSGDAGAQCVECQPVASADVAVGDSKERSKGAFVFSGVAWQSFVDAVKHNEFGQI